MLNYESNENKVSSVKMQTEDVKKFQKSASQITLYYVASSAPVVKGENIKESEWLKWLTVYPLVHDTSQLLFKTFEDAEAYQVANTVDYDPQIHHYRDDVRACRLSTKNLCLMPLIFEASISELKHQDTRASYFQIEQTKTCHLQFQQRDMSSFEFRVGRILKYSLDSKNEELAAYFELQKFMARHFGLCKKALDSNLPKDLSQNILGLISRWREIERIYQKTA